MHKKRDGLIAREANHPAPPDDGESASFFDNRDRSKNRRYLSEPGKLASRPRQRLPLSRIMRDNRGSDSARTAEDPSSTSYVPKTISRRPQAP